MAAALMRRARALWGASTLVSEVSSAPLFAFCSTANTPVAKKWNVLVNQGHEINPCGSKFHPAAQAGVVAPDTDAPTRSLQEAYTPGPAAGPNALHLQSHRAEEGGLEARISIPAQFCCFPGMISGGALTTVLECHGNWTAAIELMDTSCLPKPPLTVTYSILTTFREPTPPDTPLLIRSKVKSVKSSSSIGVGKTTVEVDLELYQEATENEPERLLVTGTGIFKRMGALRAL